LILHTRSGCWMLVSG